MNDISQIPLAERMRPHSLTDFYGQKHILAENGPLLRLLQSGVLPSMLFWGPPGVGKTTLAQIIAQQSGREFFKLNAVSSGVKDVRDVIEKAERSGFMGNYQKPVVFIDEIHRFNKSQQDSLLAAVEKGTICLMGATTENPSFEVISALLSRCQIFVLESLGKEELLQVISHALENDKWLQSKNVQIQEYEALLMLSGGDARKLLNYLEIAVASQGNATEFVLNNENVKAAIQQSMPVYDKNGEMHYDIISAFIKSMRGSDPQGAVYWLARMIEGGEDPKFIARRILIAASEDVGMANPNALLIATNCFQAVSMVGYPEAEIILAQAAIYLANSPKSNASYMAIKQARQFVKQTGNLSVPLHLRNAPTKLMKDLNYGADYKYAHDYPGSFAFQEYLPDEISGMVFYAPGDNPHENQAKTRLSALWKGKYKW